MSIPVPVVTFTLTDLGLITAITQVYRRFSHAEAEAQLTLYLEAAPRRFGWWDVWNFCEIRVYLRRNSGLTPNVRSTSHPSKNTIQSRIKIGVPTTAGTLCK